VASPARRRCAHQRRLAFHGGQRLLDGETPEETGAGDVDVGLVNFHSTTPLPRTNAAAIQPVAEPW
jgi:hypothetical protein